jgi:hypothetical protein
LAAKVTFFPVGCGDMTLITLADSAKTSILVDIHIRSSAEDEDDDSARDVAADLRKMLDRDDKGRPYVDAFLNSHPDRDHIGGFTNHFYTGPLKDYPDDKKPDAEKRIVIREMWCSLLVEKRASKTHTLVDDAKAFNKEARRRIQLNKDKKFTGIEDGDRVLVMGDDKDTKDIGPILVDVDQVFTKVNGKDLSKYFSAIVLGPLPVGSEEDEELFSKNHSSVILNMTLAADANTPDGCKFLTGGDAEVAIWDKLWARQKNKKVNLQYDLLQTPHHCSWHTLSHDSWSDMGEKAQVSKDARSALSQTRSGAIIVASSKSIKDDDKDPPCIRAKREYESIVKDAKGSFMCTGEWPTEKAQEPMTFTVTKDGPQPPAKKEGATKAAGVLSAASQPMPHGPR